MSNPANNPPVILVTGGAGYIGSRLIRDLTADPRFTGHTIRIYDNLQRRHYCGLMDLPPEGRYEFIEGDVLDRLNLARAMHGVGLVVHLAALVSTPLSFDHPEWTEQVNHWGAAAVVEQALQAGVSRVLYASSSSVYGPGGPFRETDPCRPIGPYAISKLRGEKETLRAPFTIVRLGTVFGSAPAMRYDGIANRLAYLAGVGRPLVVHGNGAEIRPLIHIRDASAALRFCLAESRAVGEIVNAVTLNPTALEIARVLQTLAPAAQIRYTDQDLLTEISFQVDAAKLAGWGFQPQVDLREGLEEVLARWRSFRPPDANAPRLDAG
jgi:UDP-glucose 4-epimerase